MQWAELSVSVLLRCDCRAEPDAKSPPCSPRPQTVTFLLVKRRTKSSDPRRRFPTDGPTIPTLSNPNTALVGSMI